MNASSATSLRRTLYPWIDELRTHIRARLFASSHTRPATRFVIFAQPRTGSTLLASLLRVHPRVHCDGEIFGKRRLFPGPFVTARSILTGKDVYGFKAMIFQLWNQKIHDVRTFMNHLHEDGWTILHMRRRDVLRQAISVTVARHRNAWSHRSGDGPLTMEKIPIAPQGLIGLMEQRERFLAEEREALEGLPHMALVYEDDLLRPEARGKTMDRVFGYLDLPPVPVRTDLVRIASGPLSDMIENYEEFVQAIGRTRYAELLHEANT